MRVFYNEIDRFASQWLTNLIAQGSLPAGYVDTRSIKNVKAEDLTDYTQAHWFAGIGGWPLALHLAGWPVDRPVWTGSCPCQPYSAAGAGKGDADPRNLWPELFRLIRECRPPTIFGEQVASAIRYGWLDGISADLEKEGYAVGACVLGAHSVGAPHIRQRLYWVAHTAGLPSLQHVNKSWQWTPIPDNTSECDGDSRLGNADSDGREKGEPTATRDGHRRSIDSDGSDCRLGDPNLQASGRNTGTIPRAETAGGSERLKDGHNPFRFATADTRFITCRDSKARRISLEPSVFPLAYGVPGDMGRRQPELAELAKSARSNRVGRLRGYGNAIVPQLAALFIRVFMEAANER